MLNCSSGTNPSANASGTIFCVAIIFCLIREAMFWNCITTKKALDRSVMECFFYLREDLSGLPIGV